MWEYCTLEWLWDVGVFRCTMPDGREVQETGSYVELVGLLNRLGSDGWEAATCVASANWLFWTLKRPLA